MIIKRINQQHARVQVTDAVLRTAMKQLTYYEEYSRTPDVPLLLFTHAKAYWRGGGWWDIMGYAADGSDVENVITRLEAVMERAKNTVIEVH